MRLFKKLLAIMPMMILFCLNGHASTCDSTSLALMEQTWKEFRAVHPFGFQTVGLKHKGDTCVFVMSEPNSWVKEKDLQQLFEKYEGQLIIKYQPYGIDGQLTDAIGCAKLDSIKFHKLEKEIFNLLYRTDYKPFYTDLDHPAEHVFFSKVPLNYSYSWEELNSVRFLVPYPNDPISELCIRELCQFMTKTNDIFFSECRGWIVWVIDEDIDYQNDSTFLINARRFALDSDLICGTFRRWNSFAIIGREREVPVTILPPLRSETILSLASTKEDLSLVFNKDSIKNVNDTLYATPIEMSNMLNDNELGNLMVLTDVLLKSWSENGKVKEYVIDHPQPNSFPFPYGVAHELGDSTKLLWKFESVEAEWSGFYPIVQTGCLPPTYWSTNDNLKRKEKIMSNIAYSYFAELNSPELVRIGMYVALYNIFHRFGIKSDFNRENSWVQTPSFTISNNSWAYGGYQGFLGKVSKGGSSIESWSMLTVSQLQDISKTQAQLAEYLTHLNNSFLDRQNVAEYLTHLNNPFSDKQIQQVLKNIERFLGIASDYKPTKPFEKRKIETTLAMSLDVLKGLSAICSDSQKWKRIESMLSKANTISNNLRAYQIIIHSVVPKDEKRGLKTDDHIKPDSSDHILTEVEVQEKKDEAIKKEKWLIDMRQTARKYGISFKDIKIIEVEKNGTIYKTYIFYYEGNKFEWAA